MRFRAPNEGQEVRVATTSGHIALVGREWRELPQVLHAHAIAAGCEVDKTVMVATPVTPAASGAAVDQRTDIQKIQDAIRDLQKKGDKEDFTNDGVPKIYSVSNAAGFRVDKEDLLKAWAELQAEK